MILILEQVVASAGHAQDRKPLRVRSAAHDVSGIALDPEKSIAVRYHPTIIAGLEAGNEGSNFPSRSRHHLNQTAAGSIKAIGDPCDFGRCEREVPNVLLHLGKDLWFAARRRAPLHGISPGPIDIAVGLRRY